MYRFLASADLLGTTFSSPAMASGFGAHLAVPLLRKVVPDESSVANIDRETAIKTVEDCMKVLFYRDARSMNKYSMAIVTGNPGSNDEPKIEWRHDVALKQQSWKFAESIKGYGAQVV